jgi:hypothetical protein
VVLVSLHSGESILSRIGLRVIVVVAVIVLILLIYISVNSLESILLLLSCMIGSGHGLFSADQLVRNSLETTERSLEEHGGQKNQRN